MILRCTCGNLDLFRIRHPLYHLVAITFTKPMTALSLWDRLAKKNSATQYDYGIIFSIDTYHIVLPACSSREFFVKSLSRQIMLAASLLYMLLNYL